MILYRNLPLQEMSEAFSYVDEAEAKIDIGFTMRGGLLRLSNDRIVLGTLTRDPRSRAMVGFGYRQVWQLSRVIWGLHNGDPKDSMVDHIDGDPSNNRISNLRLATSSQNQMNRKSSRPFSASPYIGVTRSGLFWLAFSSEKSSPIYLGSFGDPVSAARVRDNFVEKKYGEYATLNRDLFPIDFGASE